MKNNYNSKGFKSWLDKLQQESWQLELIISGFAIYGLFQAIGPLEVYYHTAQSQEQILYTIVLTAALTSCSILMFTLILHVILRGLWIGALGLRYVSGDIDYKKLNYTPKFDKYLRKRIGSFDKYIAKLEDYCSVLFAVSFLLVFYIFSLFLIFGLIAIIATTFIANNEGTNTPLMVIGIICVLLIVFGTLLTFIDFITQGFLKKRKWLAKLYFPFYWIFSFITLSFLYRPLVYNFLDNKFGRNISFILIPAYFFIVYIFTIENQRSNYLIPNRDSSINYSSTKNYDDLATKDKEFIDDASIPSKIIESTYLKVFIEFSDSIEDDLFDFNEELKPENDSRGMTSKMIKFSGNEQLSKKTRDSIETIYFKTLKEIHTIKIDDYTHTNFDLVFTRNHKKQDGFETVLNIENLTKGKHTLQINRLRKRNDSTRSRNIAIIPFWYYPN